MTTPTAKRERALSIREAALGFDNDIASTLLELADSLEAEAALEEAAGLVHESEPRTIRGIH
jgi:hypothetical protein